MVQFIVFDILTCEIPKFKVAKWILYKSYTCINRKHFFTCRKNERKEEKFNVENNKKRKETESDWYTIKNHCRQQKLSIIAGFRHK